MKKRKNSKNKNEINLEVVYKQGNLDADQCIFSNKKDKKDISEGKPNDISSLRANTNLKEDQIFKFGIRPVFKRFEQFIEMIIKNPDSSRIPGI